MDDVQKYNRRLKAVEAERRDVEDTWQDITDYILPRKGKYLTKGDKPQYEEKNAKIIDGIATRALRVLSAGMRSGLTSPARPWFKLGVVDNDLEKFEPVKVWLHEVQKRMYSVFMRSNFYSAIHSIYKEEAAFGTGCLFVEEDPMYLVRFIPMTAGQFCLTTNSFGDINTFWRRFHITARNIIDWFGKSRCSDDVLNAAKLETEQYFQVCQAITENKKRDVTKIDYMNKPYKSVYWEFDKSEKFLKTEGFEEFPVMGPRWDVTATEIYGRSPCMDILPDVKMLQEISKSQLKAIQKEVDPPMQVPSSFKDRLIMTAGGINWINPQDNEAITRLYDMRFNIADVTFKIQDIRDQIKEGLYNDLFLMLLDRPNMTATEVVERHDEKLLMLGPVIERQFFDLLNPVIERVFGIMDRAGILPEPPEEVQGEDLKIEYISLLAQAQKLVGTQSINAFLSFVGQAAEIQAGAGGSPEIIDKIDFDKAVDEYGDMTGVPPKIIKGDDDVSKIREERRIQMEQQMLLDQISQAGDQATRALGTKVEDNNAMDKLIQSVEEI